MKTKMKTNVAATFLVLVAGSMNSQEIKVLNPNDDPAIETQTKAFLSALNGSGGKPMETMTPSEARKVLEGAQASVKVDLSGIDIMEKMIHQDGLDIKIYIVRPEKKSGNIPGFMFFHGGGWVIGDFETHKRFVRDLVFYSGKACVFVEYSRSPEAKYPVAINEAYAATKWVAENGNSVGVDGSKLAVAGNSAGGNITAAVALMAKDKNGPKLKFQLLFWPVTNNNFENTSYLQYASGRFLTKNMMHWFWGHYLTKTSDADNIYASPLKASLEQLKDLPPTLIQTAENDVLRDEGEDYGRNLNKAGVPTSLVRMQGMIHDYGLLNPLAHIPEVQSALRYAAYELANHLDK
ncbi:alpha/beta hydrolase [Mariniflexile gromovii]|uniref:Alpha/beta hydrolase n=1 Tax=Mariniflexile gromovii TaxID=362523 RepID=A0ABS4BW66_9FLAO|nr:alpha/beta hydrolase [Mariniflexile gromovii]MBP0904300.1 alpha/beta hydrolase [Mariniflexile gromovii]